MVLNEVVWDDGMWMELALDRIQYQALICAVLNFRILL